MPLDADLYLGRIDWARYAGAETCAACRVDSPEEFLDRLRSGRVRPGQCPHWPPERVQAFRAALDGGRLLPAIPSLDAPRPAPSGLVELNGPAASSPVLVTGNSRLTHEVLLAVLSTTAAPMRLLAVDTGGHTVDMSLVYGTLNADTVAQALRAAEAGAGRIILPGLAGPLAAPVSESLGRPVEVGPVCAAELPLFFGPDWRR